MAIALLWRSAYRWKAGAVRARWLSAALAAIYCATAACAVILDGNMKQFPAIPLISLGWVIVALSWAALALAIFVAREAAPMLATANSDAIDTPGRPSSVSPPGT
ncbi:MAG: hypothetical protein EPN91_10430 [Salinibacterium sp.]|nr:MAG: hypothetical protein EPN91_10430 [Salinibacterium sp.]